MQRFDSSLSSSGKNRQHIPDVESQAFHYYTGRRNADEHRLEGFLHRLK